MTILTIIVLQGLGAACLLAAGMIYEDPTVKDSTGNAGALVGVMLLIVSINIALTIGGAQ